MSSPNAESSSLHGMVSQVVLCLNQAFPNYDIRFCFIPEDTCLRMKIADVSDTVLTFNLKLLTVENILHEAIFAIKSLAMHYDS